MPETNQKSPATNEVKLGYRDKVRLSADLDCDLKTLAKAIEGIPSRVSRTKKLRLELVRRGVAQNVTDAERAEAAGSSGAVS